MEQDYTFKDKEEVEEEAVEAEEEREYILPQEKDQNDFECTCDAVLFYRKYKDRIEKYFAQLLQVKEEQEPEVLEEEYNENDYDVLQELRETIDNFLNQKDGKKGGKKTAGKSKTKFKKSGDGVRDGKGKGDVIGDGDGKDDGKDGRRMIGQLEIIDSSDVGGRGDVDAELKVYEQALDMKMQLLFGEEEYSEKGHFTLPRYSTSDQSTVIRSTTSVISIPSAEEEEQSHIEKEIGEWMSDSMKRALDYLKKHMIEDLFRFLGSHLISSNPCNPVEFLINLLEQCLLFRDGQLEPPLLFRPEHVESLFNSMDPMGTGSIEISQYHVGMITLRLKEYNMFPEMFRNNLIAKHIFIEEALNALTIQLDRMLRAGITEAIISSISTICLPED